MLHIVTFLWGDRYPISYLDRLAEGVKRNLSLPHEFLAITDQANRLAIEASDAVDGVASIPDRELADRACFCRLRLFSPDFQCRINIHKGDRIVCMDLDAVITSPLDQLFEDDDAPFRILQGVNSPDHPCRFNGSLWSLVAGYRPDVWYAFTRMAAEMLPVPRGGWAGDQEWFQHMMPDAAAYTHSEGCYAFMKSCWPGGEELPPNACFVAFPGKRDPSQFERLEWVQQHWLNHRD